MAGSNSSRKPKKTLKAVPDSKFPSMLRLVFEEGGKVPEALDGMYKSHAKANEAIAHWNDGYDREKIYPRAPREVKKEEPKSVDVKPEIKASEPPKAPAPPVKKPAPERSVTDNAEETESEG